MRAQLRSDGRRVTVRSRPGRDCTNEFPELSALGEVLDDQILLDGELVCFDPRGLPDFERLRSSRCSPTEAEIGWVASGGAVDANCSQRARCPTVSAFCRRDSRSCPTVN